MIRAAILCLALQGCALLPEGSLVGAYFRIGHANNRSMNFEWSNEARDLDWKCPLDAPVVTPGIPTWMQCDGWPVLAPHHQRLDADRVF